MVLADGGRRRSRRLETTEVDVVVPDVMMPIDGFAVCRELKKSQNTASVPVILLTARDDMETRATGMKLRRERRLAKPVNKEEPLCASARSSKAGSAHEAREGGAPSRLALVRGSSAPRPVDARRRGRPPVVKWTIDSRARLVMVGAHEETCVLPLKLPLIVPSSLAACSDSSSGEERRHRVQRRRQLPERVRAPDDGDAKQTVIQTRAGPERLGHQRRSASTRTARAASSPARTRASRTRRRAGASSSSTARRSASCPRRASASSRRPTRAAPTTRRTTAAALRRASRHHRRRQPGGRPGRRSADRLVPAVRLVRGALPQAGRHDRHGRRDLRRRGRPHLLTSARETPGVYATRRPT